MIPDELAEGFRTLLRGDANETAEQRRRRRRARDFRTGVKLICFALVTPVAYMLSSVAFGMSGTSPLGWTITAGCAAAFLWAGVVHLSRRD